MAHILESEHDAAWKDQVRGRIMKNLDVMLQDAHRAYLHKISEVPVLKAEIRHGLHVEYTQNAQGLRYIAEEEIRAEIEREERERKWTADAGSHGGIGSNETLIEEQVAILQAIRAQANKSVHRTVVHEYNGIIFQQGSSSRPLSSGSSSSANGPVPPPSPSALQVKVETDADREARARREKYEKQQEEFRKRAEEIQTRKRQQREREWNSNLHRAENMSTSSSNTSASDQEKSDFTPRMSEEDIINLMIFHDQQWTTISALPHLQWTDFPWPYLSFSAPQRKEDLTLDAVSEYMFAPLNIHHDRAIVKDRLKDLIRRWHPDRFEVKYLARIADLHERELVREGAGVVARVLNDLLGKWNDQ